MKLFTFPNVYFSTLSVLFILDRYGLMSRHGSAFSLIDQPLAFTPFPDEFVQNIPFLFYGIILVPVLHLWREFIKSFLAAPVARDFAGLHSSSAKHEKFLENFWLAFHYLCAVSLECYVMSQLSIWPPMVTYESKIALSPPYQFYVLEQRNNIGIQAIYLLQFTFYFLELITLVAYAKTKRRSDFFVYLFHHIYTVFLLGFSWITINHRLGMLVLIFHDVADIFLPIGKCMTYAEKHVRRNFSGFKFRCVERLGLAAFAMFVICFIVPRLFLLFHAMHFSIYELRWLMYGVPPDTPENQLEELFLMNLDSWVRPHANVYIIVLLLVLILLYPMHIFWALLIMKMIKKMISGPEYGTDVRSDDEDEEEQSNQKEARS